MAKRLTLLIHYVKELTISLQISQGFIPLWEVSNYSAYEFVAGFYWL